MTAAQLRPTTLVAWNDYIQSVESRVQSAEASNVLWMDNVPGRRERVRSGEIIAESMNEKPSQSVPHGLIHDWIGVVFIPRVSLSDVLAIVRNYEKYGDYYGPTVRTAKLLFRSGEIDSFRIRYVRKALFTRVVLDVDYEARYCRLNEHQWYSVARSTSVRQIQDYGETGEHALPADEGSGYIWRAFSISRLHDRDGGVYIEQESSALSRNFPLSLRWLVEPFVERLSRQLVIESLRRTRDAVVPLAVQID